MKTLNKPDLIRLINDAQSFKYSDRQLAFLLMDSLIKVLDVSVILGKIMDTERAKAKKKEQLLYQGMDCASQMLGTITQDLTENRTSHKAKNSVRLFLEENLSWATYMFHALNPKGHARNDHVVGKYMFAWFVRSLKAKERSPDWEESVGVKDYLDLVIKENPDKIDVEENG